VRAFEYYLRTGRRLLSDADAEYKFNPWHDPDNGRFTFAGQGHYSAGGSPASSGRDRQSDTRQAGSNASAQRTATWRAGPSRHAERDPRNPRNFALYTVKRGDTLTKIARLRKGLTAADLAWLNNQSADRPLQIGQRIKVPHQQYLDEGKRARDNFLTLAHYSDATGGKLPPNVAHPPSMAVQIEAGGVHEVRANGYRFDIDTLTRTRQISGDVRLEPEYRSRSAQANAGKPDRRSTDDGGHYIAARFKGPREWFNHFAQDANFNRGAYRRLEDQWAKAIRSGQRVFVDIVPYYRGASMRPYMLNVTWYTNGRRSFQEFQNEKTDD